MTSGEVRSLISDETLYDRYLDGENEALDELLLRYRESLTLFLLGYVKNEQDAEDLMMETFAMLLSKDVSFGKKSSFKTWLFGIGRNLARNHSRKSHFLLFGDGGEAEITAVTPGADYDFLKEERRMQLYAAMQKLNEDYRTVLYMQFFENMTTAETAAVMKKSEKQVYNLTARAKARLKEILEGGGFEYAEY